MKKFLQILLLLPVLTGSTYATEIYKCTVNGRVTFTDAPCDGAKVELGDINTASSASLGDGTYSSSQWYIDYAGYESALVVSRRAKVPMFIYFQADWCRYCRQLERDIFDTAVGRDALRKVVKVRISPENGAAEDAFFNRLGGTGYPTVFIKRDYNAAPQKVAFSAKKSSGRDLETPDYLRELIENQFTQVD